MQKTARNFNCEQQQSSSISTNLLGNVEINKSPQNYEFQQSTQAKFKFCFKFVLDQCTLKMSLAQA